MEESLIYDLLEKEYIFTYREELEKCNNYYMEWINKERKNLEKILNKKQLKAVDSYKLSCKWREDYLDYLIGIKTLNYGIKIGMEMQKAFEQQEE